MREARLERVGAVDLVFTGEEIAEASSAEPGKPRWTELTLWRTAKAWVIERRGHSVVPREVTLRDAVICLTPEAIVAALAKTDNGHRYLPTLAVELLEAAAEADERLRVVAVERA